MEFIRSALVKDRTTATEKLQRDLPTHPISHLIITLDGYNVTDETTLAEFLAFLNSVTVSHNGKTIHYSQSEDLYGLNAYLFRRLPILEGRVATDNQRRVLGLIVPFGRRIFDADECFPASSKGELTLEVDTTVPATSIDNSTLNIEVVQLPEASPQRYLKCNTKTISAPGATGDNEVELPIGNKLAALQLRMTTFNQASSHSYGVDSISTYLNEQEHGFAYARTQCLVTDMISRIGCPSATVAAQGTVLPANIVWADFDPNSDGNYLLETQGASRCHAVLNMGVDEATYLTTMELVDV